MASSHARAFTLIEILIVIGIILFLIKMVLPRLGGYMGKARQTEVSMHLANLYSAEQAYRVEHGTYTSNLEALGWKPKQHVYTYGFSNAAHKGGTFYVGSGKTPGSMIKKSVVDSDHFVARAVLKKDDGLDSWSIDETGTITHETK